MQRNATESLIPVMFRNARSPRGSRGMFPIAVMTTLMFWQTAPAAATQPPMTNVGTRTDAARRHGVDEGNERLDVSGVSNVFVDTDLRQALQDIAAQTGITIIPDPTVSGLVTAELENVPVDEALDIVLAGTGYDVKEFDGYRLVFAPDPASPAFEEISEHRIVKLDYADTEAAMGLVRAAHRRYLRADSRSNTVSVTAPQRILERILSTLKLIDTPPGHVMLEARVVVLENSALLNMGIQWDFPQIRAGVFTNADLQRGHALGPDWPWGLQIGYTPGREFTNSLLLNINMLSQNKQADVIARPRIVAQDGKQAEVRVVTVEYFRVISSGGFYERVDLEQIETGTVLQIKPRISANGQITLSMTTEVSDVVGRGDDDLPVVTRRSTSSTVRVRDGGTAVVAGLSDSRTESASSRVPGAGRLPWIGRLFHHDHVNSHSREIAVFVTASTRKALQRERRAGLESVGHIHVPLDEAQFRRQLQQSLQNLDTEGSPQ